MNSNLNSTFRKLVSTRHDVALIRVLQETLFGGDHESIDLESIRAAFQPPLLKSQLSLFRFRIRCALDTLPTDILRTKRSATVLPTSCSLCSHETRQTSLHSLICSCVPPSSFLPSSSLARRILRICTPLQQAAGIIPTSCITECSDLFRLSIKELRQHFISWSTTISDWYRINRWRPFSIFQKKCSSD